MITLGDSVVWLWHPGVYVVIDKDAPSGLWQLRERGVNTMFWPWVKGEDLTALTEQEAMAKIMRERPLRTTRGDSE